MLCVRATGVSYLHFETVGPTVPCLVPGRFNSDPMGWVSLFSSWLAGGAGVPSMGVWLVIIVVSVCWISWMALDRAALVATRLSMVAFFWMDTLARLSSDDAICCACSISAAWLAPKVVLPVVMRAMLCILANAAVQCVFQFAHLCSIAGRRFHFLQPSVMLPVESGCLEPVVTIISLKIRTPAL